MSSKVHPLSRASHSPPREVEIFQNRTLLLMGNEICMEARDPDDFPRVLSYRVWLEVSSDPWPFFRAKQACHRTEGLMGESAARMGEGATESLGLQMQDGKRRALWGSRLLPERSP